MYLTKEENTDYLTEERRLFYIQSFFLIAERE